MEVPADSVHHDATTARPATQAPHTWMAPMEGIIKINCDIGIQQDTRCGLGMVATNRKGEVMTSGFQRLTQLFIITEKCRSGSYAV
ncbi:hypothetical protein JCGZ_09497 [Jatropha curcas]|uniref:RNase H type-1 domain-containing protein n=1 Tax=Jatropha curcas TaxID=180498 RepID=A0A067KXA5_JATCU|nr:hypothetical protein JCGZ_09497 [Jatropha curcas]